MKNTGLKAFESGSRLSGQNDYETLSSFLDLLERYWILLFGLDHSKVPSTCVTKGHFIWCPLSWFPTYKKCKPINMRQFLLTAYEAFMYEIDFNGVCSYCNLINPVLVVPLQKEKKNQVELAFNFAGLILHLRTVCSANMFQVQFENILRLE